MPVDNMAELEPNPHALPLDATPRSRNIHDRSEIEAVALDSGVESCTDANNEVKLKGEIKLAAADDQAGFPTNTEQGAVILVMGIKGAGKSSFINCLTGRDVEIGHSLQSRTSKVGIYPFTYRKRTTLLVDTPSFDNTCQTNSEVLQEIAHFLCQTYANGIKITGIIYLHRITDFHVTLTSIMSLCLLKALCGNTLLSNLVLTTSRWDCLSSSNEHRMALSREEDLRLNFYKDILERGASLYRHDNTKESALRIIDHIQSLKGDMNLEIQKEMIEHNRRLDQTLAGQVVLQEVSDTIKKQKKNLEILDEFPEDFKANDLKIKKYIEDERRSINEMIVKLDETAAKWLYLDFKGLKEERKRLYQDEAERLKLDKSPQKTLKDINQKQQARAKASSLISTNTVRRSQSRARNPKLLTTAAADLGNVISQDAAHFRPFTKEILRSMTTRGTGALMKPFTEQIESCGEPLGATSTDESEKQDQRISQERTLNDSKLSSSCSEESWVGDASLPSKSPEEAVLAREPDQKPSQCYDLPSSDCSTEAEGAGDVQNTPGSSGVSSSVTDSFSSDDATDLEEDSGMEHDTYQLDPGGSGRLPTECRETLIQDVLDPVKKEMVDRLMEEFWIIFRRKWPIGARLCTAARGSNSASTSGGALGSENTSSTYSVRRLRAYEGSNQADDENPDDAPGEGGAQPRNPGTAPNTKEAIDFACPYRKRNPRKYCVRDWRTCTLSPLKGISRVKAHLYRYHTIHQCQRCKCLLKSKEELNSHIETSDRCDATLAPPVDGITRKIREVLQSKRKAFPGQTEAQRWKQIYQILFPDDEEVPDPYFEPVRDNNESEPHNPDLMDLSNYEQFLRHSLPRLVRSALETEINNDIQPIEERLRERLPDLVEHALSRASLEYRAMADSIQNGHPSVDSGYILNHSRSASCQDKKGKGPITSPRAETAMLSTAYPNHVFESSDALLSPFMETASPSNLEPSAHIHQSFENMDSVGHLQVPENLSADTLSSERHFLSNPSFPDQLGDPISNMMDMDSFNWELPPQHDPGSNY